MKDDNKEEKRYKLKSIVLLIVIFLGFCFLFLSILMDSQISENEQNAILYIFLFIILIFVFAFFLIMKYGTSSKSYQTEMDLQEFMVFAFYKKRCPECGRKVEKKKRTKHLGRGEFSGVSGHTRMYGDIYKVEYYFNCPICNKDMEIMEFAKTKKSKR